jgi:hypothetical protein
MRKCLKCQMIYTDASKICRSCGSIIDDVDDTVAAEEAPPTTDATPAPAAELEDAAFEEAIAPEIAAAADSLPTSGRHDDWICLKCGERVPSQFDVCWNCFAVSGDFANAGAPIAADPPIAAAPSPQADAPRETMPQRAPRPPRPCPACGSDKIIPSIGVIDHEGYGVKVSVEGNPEAAFFKDRRYGSLVADICGACGHLHLRVGNFAELYRHYLDSRER